MTALYPKFQKITEPQKQSFIAIGSIVFLIGGLLFFNGYQNHTIAVKITVQTMTAQKLVQIETEIAQIETEVAQATSVQMTNLALTPTATPTNTPTVTSTVTPQPTNTPTPTNTPMPTRVPCQDFKDNTRLEVGDRARVEYSHSGRPKSNRLREGASPDSTYIMDMREGTRMTIIDGPICNEYIFWKIRTDRGQTGWTAEGVLDRSKPDYWLEPLD